MLFYIFFPSSLATKNLHQHIKLHLIAAFPSLFFFFKSCCRIGFGKSQTPPNPEKNPQSDNKYPCLTPWSL